MGDDSGNAELCFAAENFMLEEESNGEKMILAEVEVVSWSKRVILMALEKRDNHNTKPNDENQNTR